MEEDCALPGPLVDFIANRRDPAAIASVGMLPSIGEQCGADFKALFLGEVARAVAVDFAQGIVGEQVM